MPIGRLDRSGEQDVTQAEQHEDERSTTSRPICSALMRRVRRLDEDQAHEGAADETTEVRLPGDVRTRDEAR